MILKIQIKFITFYSKLIFLTNFKFNKIVQIENTGSSSIGWAIKTTNPKRLYVDPPCGVLDSKKDYLMAISCEPYDFINENTKNDRITIEWANAPKNGGNKFRREWFQKDGMIRRKNIKIEYNP